MPFLLSKSSLLKMLFLHILGSIFKKMLLFFFFTRNMTDNLAIKKYNLKILILLLTFLDNF